jgi:hypothetical protein
MPILLTTLGLLVAAVSVRYSFRASNRARQASLSWSIYQEYSQPAIRAARGAVQMRMCSPGSPTNGVEYLDDIADGSPWKSNIDDSLDADVRRLLRFYNQLSVLIEKQLIDEDFVFTMIGPGLVTAWPVLESALAYYEFYYPRDGKVDWQTEPRLIYDGVPMVHKRYVCWSAQQHRRPK